MRRRRREATSSRRPRPVRRPRFPTASTTPFGDQRDGRVLEHLDLAHDAVAAGGDAGAAAARPQRVAPHAHRVRALERLDRRVARVRHRGVHAVHARSARSAGRPGRRRSSRSTPSPSPPTSTLFIVPWTRRRPDPGAACASAPRHTSATRWLTSTLPAPTATGSRAATTEPGGCEHPDRPQHAAVRGDVGIDDRSQREHDRAHRHGLDRVHDPGALRVGAREVERDRVAGDGDRHADARRARRRRGRRSSRARRRSATRRRAARAIAARMRRSP